MEHLMRIIFWTVTLLCLQARSVPVKELQISKMQSRVKCLSDSKFYTPENVEKRCITAALDCVMRELQGTVRKECTDNEDDIDRTLDFIEAAIEEWTSEGLAMTNSSECACEKWSQRPFTEFLDKLKSLLYFANTVASV